MAHHQLPASHLRLHAVRAQHGRMVGPYKSKHNHGCRQRLPVSGRGQAQQRTQCPAQHQRQICDGSQHARKQQHIQIQLAHHRLKLNRRASGKLALCKAPRQQPCTHAGKQRRHFPARQRSKHHARRLRAELKQQPAQQAG